VQPIQHAIPGALVAMLRDAPLSPGKIGFAWRAAVGPAVGRVTAVRLEGRVLLVDAASRAWANEVIRSSPVILKRLHALLGKEALASISVRDH
jgi:predicted nucleic acid-binding Zn ribbon protein